MKAIHGSPPSRWPPERKGFGPAEGGTFLLRKPLRVSCRKRLSHFSGQAGKASPDFDRDSRSPRPSPCTNDAPFVRGTEGVGSQRHAVRTALRKHIHAQVETIVSRKPYRSSCRRSSAPVAAIASAAAEYSPAPIHRSRCFRRPTFTFR